MNERIKQLAEQAGAEIKSLADGTDYRSLYKEDGTGFDLEKFAELILKEAFTIIKESMVGNDNVSNIDEIIADRLDEAACDVCDKLELMGPIYEG